MKKRERLIDYINSMGVDGKIALHNAYCDAVNDPDGRIYELDELEEVLYDVDKWELVNMIRFGNFDFMKDFWGFDGYANLESYNAWELPIYPTDIAAYMLRTGDDLENDEIQKIMDKEDEDNA